MTTRIVTATAAALLLMTGMGFAQNKDKAPGQDRVCLLTFNSAGAVQGGANKDIVKAQWLPRKAAENQASKHPERVIGSVQYGSQWNEALCEQFRNGDPG
jgi:hypothetical protein